MDNIKHFAAAHAWHDKVENYYACNVPKIFELAVVHIDYHLFLPAALG